MHVDITLDALGLLCPLPVLKAQKALKSMDKNQVLSLLTNDPAAQIDVPHFCAESGHEFLGHADSGDGTVYFIRHK